VRPKPPADRAAHSVTRTLREIAWYPEHDPRRASPEYRAVHRRLVVDLDTPCWICGVRHSTGGRMETHHAEVEWAAELAFEDDPEMLRRLVADMRGQIRAATPEALRAWLDSEGNMLVLCALHHRGAYHGIHTISYPIWKLQRYEHAGGFRFTAPGPSTT